MDLGQLFKLTYQITDARLNLFDYFEHSKYSIFVFGQNGNISHKGGEDSLFIKSTISHVIKENRMISGYRRVFDESNDGIDIFFFNENILDTELELKQFWSKDVEIYRCKLVRVIVEFLAINHLLQTIEFEFDVLDLLIGEKIHELVQCNKKHLSTQILMSHDRYLGAILSKCFRNGYKESAEALESLSKCLEEIVTDIPSNYFMDVYKDYQQKLSAYENRIISFIDVLGFKEIVKKHSPEEIRDIISELKSIREPISIDSDYNQYMDFRITCFSDCIILSCKCDCLEKRSEILKDFLSVVRGIQLHFMKIFQCLVRGAICEGNLVHTKDYCFGPAFNRAYFLESTYANFSRILIDIGLLQKYNIDDYSSFGIYKGEVFDFLDLVSICFYPLKKNGGWNDDYWNFDCEWRFFRLVELISNGLKVNSETVKIKYRYLANRFNIYLREFFEAYPEKEYRMLSVYPEINQKLDYINIE